MSSGSLTYALLGAVVAFLALLEKMTVGDNYQFMIIVAIQCFLTAGIINELERK